MKFIIKRISNNLLFYIHFFSFFIICMFPSFLYVMLNEDGDYKYIFSSFVYVFPLVSGLVLISNSFFRLFLELLITFSIMMEVVMVVQYNNYLVAGNILAVFSTTYGEGFDFLCNSLKSFIYIIPILFLSVFLFLSRDFIDKSKFFIASFAISIIFSFSYLCVLVNRSNQTFTFYFEQNVCNRPPYNFAFQLYNVVRQQWIRRLISESKGMKYYAVKEKQIDNREIYVLAIGESCRYDNLSLSGYSRKTTPMLESISNVSLFTNYYSTACLTMYSVPQILTRATPLNFELNYKEKTVLQPFAECGFSTFVIVHKSNLLSYEKYLSNGASELHVVDEDDDIPIKIDSIAKIYPKSFFIVQFLGSHSSYRNFKKEQDVFHPNPISDDVSWENMDAMVNAYDNTILFMDYVLSNIINNIDQDSIVSALLYISDHGEDFRPGSGGHGGTAKPNKEEYHVPMIFWHSNMWLAFFPEKQKVMCKNRMKSVNADNVFYSICDMANIRLGEQYAIPKWSVFSEKYESHDRFLLLPDGTNVLKLD